MKLGAADIEELEQRFNRALFSTTGPFPDHSEVFEATRKFVLEFSTQLCHKSASKSKLEALCPAIEPAKKRNSILFTMGKASTDNFEEMHQELMDCGEIHREISSIVGKDSPVAILIIYPDGDGHQMLEATNPDRFETKADLLRNGIMGGAFHEGSEFTSTFDPNLKPLGSPYPTFILRNAVSFDWVFLGSVPTLRDIYLERFGNPPEMLREVHCPYTKFKMTLARLFSKQRRQERRYSDGGRKKFWSRKATTH